MNVQRRYRGRPRLSPRAFALELRKARKNKSSTLGVCCFFAFFSRAPACLLSCACVCVCVSACVCLRVFLCCLFLFDFEFTGWKALPLESFALPRRAILALRKFWMDWIAGPMAVAGRGDTVRHCPVLVRVPRKPAEWW